MNRYHGEGRVRKGENWDETKPSYSFNSSLLWFWFFPHRSVGDRIFAGAAKPRTNDKIS
jgi:hypothetical protein